MDKHMLVLANSIKKSGHCVAGREVISDGKDYRFGAWIRPISDRGEGELNTAEITLAMNRQCAVGDFVQIELESNVMNQCQPENWLVSEESNWNNMNASYALPAKALFDQLLIESPQSLWIQPNQKTDRISADHLAKNRPKQSLYLIRPSSFRIKLFTSNWGKAQRRGLFEYNGTHYDLGLTDPVLAGKYFGTIPSQSQPAKYIDLPCGSDVRLCVSLTGVLRGDHYKVIATVIEGDSIQ